MTLEQAAWWLAGFIDGEGCVAGGTPKPGKRYVRAIQVTNTDYGLIETCVQALTTLGIASYVYARLPDYPRDLSIQPL